MSQEIIGGSFRAAVAVTVLSMAMGWTLTMPAWAEEAGAKNLFKAMSDYVSGQKTISFKYNSNVEIVTPDLQKLTFASSGAAIVNRPDKIRVTRTGGFADVELTYDGKSLGLYGKNLNAFTKIAMTGSLDEVIDTLRFDFGLEAPAADLLSSNPNETMMSNVTDTKDLGSGVIGGVECDHLAFRTLDTDWQIWITQGDKPRPCRFTITSKTLALAPEYTVEVTEWKDGSDVASDDFNLKTAADAKEVKVEELQGLDEIPNLSGKGGAQ
ncbi:DUF2092 domain-containing protein [Mesorhizobium jarvisii]|uniref:DUF2092 domain-containing protein n=1 Tax=Mesorhizobium jarvisii TaxID=1777867 RepID=UPI001F0A0D8C|nr:DUF2092 domain-containing protein [Mesorhizobium jarvisii]MCH4561063.1 DUF2092 domain-containing protein [Mesorhizobium jarvisii]